MCRVCFTIVAACSTASRVACFQVQYVNGMCPIQHGETLCIIVIECNDYGSCSLFSRNWAMNLVIEQSNMIRHDPTSMSCNLICFAQADIGSEPSGGAFPTRALLLVCQAHRDERNWCCLQSMQDVYISNLQQPSATFGNMAQVHPRIVQTAFQRQNHFSRNWQIANLLVPAIVYAVLHLHRP